MNNVFLVMVVALAGLMGLLGFRVLTLFRNQTWEATPTGALTGQQPAPSVHHREQIIGSSAVREKPTARPSSPRSELITCLHILLSLQMRDCQDQGLDLKQAPGEVRQYAVAWFYGAACTLCEPGKRHSEELMELVASVVARKFGSTDMAALQAIMSLTQCSVRLGCFRSGLDGAQAWLGRRFVPTPLSLYTAITSYALV